LQSTLSQDVSMLEAADAAQPTCLSQRIANPASLARGFVLLCDDPHHWAAYTIAGDQTGIREGAGNDADVALVGIYQR